MAYTRPSASAADATWQGVGAYVRPAAGYADASFAPASFDATIAVVIPVVASVDLVHGVAALFAAGIPVVAAIDAEHATIAIDVDIAASVPVAAAIDSAHGVAAGFAAVVPVAAVLSVAHGQAGSVSGLIGVAASIAAVHERYEVRGEVRLGGVLVNRRVRCSKRATGELMGQADTVAGVYRVHAGFDEADVYVTAIDMAEAATDWIPPTANRLVPVLASDTA